MEKIDVGLATEDEVQRFVEHAFSEDFVFRSPNHTKGREQKETTDVLAIFDDVVIAIEVKAQAYPADGSPRENDPSWTKKKLAKAVDQIRGAIRSLKTVPVRMANSRRGRMQYDPSKALYNYGLVVLNHPSEPFVASDIVPEIAEADFPIHVLSFRDFYNLNRVLDTPGDLVGYLEMRADILIPTLTPRVHEEQRVFEYFLKHFEELTEFRAKMRGDDVSAADMAPYAEAYRQIYRGEYPGLTASRFIDKVIARVHEVDDGLESPFEDKVRCDKTQYARIAEALTRIVRPRRALLGREFHAAIARAAEKNDLAFATTSSKSRDECILFMASPRPDSERAQRTKELRDLLLTLKATRQVSCAFGIATEAGFGAGRSYDFILAEEPPDRVAATPDYEQIRKMGEDLFGLGATPPL